jgi:creatinine amidohydrolase
MRPNTLIEVVKDIGGGLAASGFEYILIINGCAGNIPTLMVAVSQLKESYPVANFILTGSIWETPDAIKEVRESEIGGIGHACEIETSISLVVDPKHVQMDKAENEKYAHPSQRVSLDFEFRAPFYWPISFNEVTQSGVIGDPTLANVEKGKFVLDANIKRLSDILCHINDLASKPA